MDYRALYEKHYGISIPKDFHVHHIDGDRSNNSIGNLILLPSRIHAALHFENSCLAALFSGGMLPILKDPHQITWYRSHLQNVVKILPEIHRWSMTKEMEDLCRVQGVINEGPFSYQDFR